MKEDEPIVQPCVQIHRLAGRQWEVETAFHGSLAADGRLGERQVTPDVVDRLRRRGTFW